MTQLAAEEDKKPADPPPADARATPEASESPENSLVTALRAFVRHEAHAPASPPAHFRFWTRQTAILLVIAFDAVLVYSLCQKVFEGPVFKFALEALPWLLGATAFAHSDRVREWILGLAKRLSVGGAALIAGLLLLAIRLPLFSVILVTPSSSSIRVQAENPADKLDFRTLDSARMRVTVPNLLKTYRIKVTDIDESLQPKEFSRDLGPGDALFGTFAQLPLVWRFFRHSAIPLQPLYKVMLEPSGDGWVDVKGSFEAGFLNNVHELSLSRCAEFHESSSNIGEIRCNVKADQIGAFPLPPGQYTVESFLNGCAIPKKSTLIVPKPENTLELETECPH